MNEIMITLNEEYEPVAKYKSVWESREYCLSQIAVSPTGADRVTPENMHAEAIIRQAIISHSQLMSNETLKVAFEDAINEKQDGKAILYAAVGNSREKSAKIDTSKIELPFQKVALEKYRAIGSLIENAILDLREANGTRPDMLSTERLTAARGEN